MRYQIFPIVMTKGQLNIPDDVLAGIWRQMVEEEKAQKVFYNGYITSVYDFINFIKNSGVLPILIADNETESFVHIAWISDYGGGHACMHHCSLGKFKRGAGKAILKYYELFQDPEAGGPAFQVLIGITPENNAAAVRVAKLMGFKIVGTVPMLCHDVYADKRIGGVISYYQYHREETQSSQVDKGAESWVEERAAEARA